MSAFVEPTRFAFVPTLEAAFSEMRGEVAALPASAFTESPDSLTTVRDGYDERGWLELALLGDLEASEDVMAANRALCPRTAEVCASLPGVVNALVSLFRPGTHLFPHRGEREGVLRCHLPLVVPAGDLGLRAGGETRRWVEGECLVFDDRFEHEAWNRGDGDRLVLIATVAV